MRNLLEYIGGLLVGIIVLNLIMINICYLLIPDLEYGFNLFTDLIEFEFIFSAFFMVSFLSRVKY